MWQEAKEDGGSVIVKLARCTPGLYIRSVINILSIHVINGDCTNSSASFLRKRRGWQDNLRLHCSPVVLGTWSVSKWRHNLAYGVPFRVSPV